MGKVHSGLFRSEVSMQSMESDLDTRSPEKSRHVNEWIFNSAQLDNPDPTESNVTKFLKGSDYNEDESKEFQFLIEQGFNIDEASDLVFQRRLNTFNIEQEPPIYQISGRSNASVVSGGDSAYTPSGSRGAVSTPGGTSSAPPNGKKKKMHIPLRATSLAGDREKDVAQLVGRGYTLEQAHEICDQIYADRLAAEQSRQLQKQDGVMSVADNSNAGSSQGSKTPTPNPPGQVSSRRVPSYILSSIKI